MRKRTATLDNILESSSKHVAVQPTQLKAANLANKQFHEQVALAAGQRQISRTLAHREQSIQSDRIHLHLFKQHLLAPSEGTPPVKV